MKTQFLLRIFTGMLLLTTVELSAQVAINSNGSAPDNSAMLDVKSTTMGILAPRMTFSERDGISNPANGLLVFCTDNNHFYMNKGTALLPNWVMMSSQWFSNGNDIYFSCGNVGLGLTNPSYPIDVAGDINYSGTLRKNGVPIVTGVSSVTASLPLLSTGGANPNIWIQQANSITNGFLSWSDWLTFYNKQNALTFGSLTSGDITVAGGIGSVIGSGTTLSINKGNLTENGSSVLAITGGTGTLLGNGASIQVKQANTSQSGYLTNTDWNTFANKQNSLILPLSVTNGGTGTANGSIVGTGALTFTAGGTNQNVTLLPSGTGKTVLYGNVGIGTEISLAKLSLTNTGTQLLGTCASAVFRTMADDLGTIQGNELSLASFGFNAAPSSVNNSSLGIRAYRTAAGSSWHSTSIGLEMDVDNTLRSGASLWLNANGSVGIGLVDPIQKLEVLNGMRIRVPSGEAQYYFDWSYGGIIGSTTSWNLKVSDAGNVVQTMRILNNGLVGIGNITPARTLHVNAVMRLEPISTSPTNPSKGDIYFDSTINKLRVYDGTTWQNCW